jgi:calcineurin-like phosphoesterase family protein
MGQVWVTSDWHFMHDRDFIYKPRGFNSAQEMTEEIIRHHNEVVQPEDDVYVLGDLMLNDNNAGMAAIKQLKGQIHVIRGNHDTDTRMDLYRNCHNIVEVCEGKFLKHNGYNFYLSHYPCLTSNCDEDKPLNRRMIGIAGHCHVQDPFADWGKGLIFHCEVDSNSCYPWNLNDIIELIKQKEGK